MPDGFALAALSQALRTRVRQVIAAAADQAQTGQFDIVSKPPELLASPAPGKATLTLYPCRLIPNPGWASSRQAAYAPTGERQASALLALDVQYVLAGYAPQADDVERVLGQALLALHETPQLSRTLILDAAAGAFPSNSPLPQALRELADQPAPITIQPLPLQLEDFSNLWSALNSGVRTGMVYLVGTLLMESRRRAASAPPVREGRLSVTQLRVPTITRLTFAPTATGTFRERAIAEPSEFVRIEGSGLKGDITSLAIGERLISIPAAALKPDQLTAQLPADLRPGLVSVQVRQDWAKPAGKLPPPATGQITGERSNLVPLAIRPVLKTSSPFTSSASTTLPDGTKTNSVTIQFQVKVGKKQRVELLLNALNAGTDGRFASFTFASETMNPNAPDGDVAQRTIKILGVPQGNYLARVAIDGGESALREDSSGVVGPILAVPS